MIANPESPRDEGSLEPDEEAKVESRMRIPHAKVPIYEHREISPAPTLKAELSSPSKRVFRKSTHI
jgi:hypothetical protein